MKLIAVLDSPHYTDGKRWFSKWPTTKFIEKFLSYFEEIQICAPTRKVKISSDNIDGLVLNKRLKMIPLPFWEDTEGFLKNFLKDPFKILKIIKENVKKNDVVWIRLPSFMTILFFPFAKFYKKPVIALIVGNIREAWDKSKYRNIKKIIAFMAVYLLHKIQDLLVKYSFTLIAGRELYELYKEKKRTFLFIDALVSPKNIYNRKDTCQNKRIKLLYVGNLLDTKGIHYLLNAEQNLLKQRYTMELIIVGSGPYKKRYRKQVENLGIKKWIKFKGYVPFGRKLFRIYKSSDILVIPSFSEGIPRVLIEAWSFGLPVIATKVGGIVGIAQDRENAILINPRSSSEIVEAIKEIVENPELRRRMIRNGLKTAKIYTYEKQVKRIMQGFFMVYPYLKDK